MGLRAPSIAAKQAELDAMIERVDTMFDEVIEQVNAMLEDLRRSGVLRDANARTRDGD